MVLGPGPGWVLGPGPGCGLAGVALGLEAGPGPLVGLAGLPGPMGGPKVLLASWLRRCKAPGSGVAMAPSLVASSLEERSQSGEPAPSPPLVQPTEEGGDLGAGHTTLRRQTCYLKETYKLFEILTSGFNQHLGK